MEKKVEGIYDGFKELGTGKMLVLGLQHVFAMFGGEHAKIKDNLLRWKDRNKGPEIGGRKWDRSGRNTTKTSGRMRSSYRVQAQRL